MARLLHVTTTDMSLELLLGPQLRAFRDAGYEVHTASAAGPYVSNLEAGGIIHHTLRHATRSFAPAHDAAAAAELYRLFRHVRPQIVHTHNPKPGVYGRIAARAARVPRVVNTQHGLYAQPADRALRRWPVYGLERLAAACSDLELVQNSEDLETLAGLGVPRAKLRPLGNGIDLGRFHPQPSEVREAVRAELAIHDQQTVVIGAVGRLVWEKGYAELFAAAARLIAGRRDVVVVVAGPHDPDKGDLLTPADVASAEAAGIRFLGHRDDPERLYAGFDVYVLASHREGFPRSAMEAAASGLPIVATDIRGCREVVDHGVTGLLVPVRDPAALETALDHLVGDPALRQRLGAAAALKAIRDFDQRRVIERTLEAYRPGAGEDSDRLRPFRLRKRAALGAFSGSGR